MRDSLYIGSAPYGEDCAQVGADDYRARARAECHSFRRQLIRMFGEPPEGCSLVIKSNPHDFGSYLSVDAVFDGDNDEAVQYAYRCESEGPQEWDAEARQELHLV
jgi:hypothetical protein